MKRFRTNHRQVKDLFPSLQTEDPKPNKKTNNQNPRN